MTEHEMKELAKAAAHSAVVARYSNASALVKVDEESTINYFLNAYEYAMQKLYEKQQQAQNQSFQEFGNAESINAAKFR